MQKLGDFTDTDIQSEYTLYYGTIAEVKDHLIKAYGHLDPNDFISNNDRGAIKDILTKDTAKIAGLYHNAFLITQNLFTDTPLLIDGFSRLFVAFDQIKAQNVFIKDYTTLTNAKAMSLLGIVNFWKTTASFTPLFDRGFTLYMFMKFGYNIKPLLNNRQGEPIIGYFDINSPLFYLYDWRRVKLDPKMIFNNERVFDDILALGKLYDLRTHEGHPYAVQFYAILNGYRTKEPNKAFDTEAFITWLSTTPKMAELAIKLNNSHNVTSKETIMTEAYQIAWNKYILPVVFGEQGKQTIQEKKKAFQAMATKTKKDYKKITFGELINVPVGTKIFYIWQDITTFRFELTNETFLGHTSKEVNTTLQLSIMAQRQGRTSIETEHTFSFKKEDGTEFTREIINSWYLNNDSEMYIKK